MATTTYYYAFVGKSDIEEQMIILERLKDYANGWCAIEHNKDEGIDNHVHFLFSSNYTIKNLQVKMEKEFHLEQVQNKRAYAKYMLHQTEQSEEDGKYKYSLKNMEFSSNRFATDLGLRKEAEQSDIEDKANILFEVCFSSKSYTGLVRKAINCGVYDELRRGFSIWKEIFTENRYRREVSEKTNRSEVDLFGEEVNMDVNLEEFFD